MERIVDHVGGFYLVTGAHGTVFHVTLYCADGCGSRDVVAEASSPEEAREIHEECRKYLTRTPYTYVGGGC